MSALLGNQARFTILKNAVQFDFVVDLSPATIIHLVILYETTAVFHRVFRLAPLRTRAHLPRCTTAKTRVIYER
jgi:hypothetical protein